MWNKAAVCAPFTLPEFAWNPKTGPIKTTELLREVYIGFHESLAEGIP